MEVISVRQKINFIPSRSTAIWKTHFCKLITTYHFGLFEKLCRSMLQANKNNASIAAQYVHLVGTRDVSLSSTKWRMYRGIERYHRWPRATNMVKVLAPVYMHIMRGYIVINKSLESWLTASSRLLLVLCFYYPAPDMADYYGATTDRTAGSVDHDMGDVPTKASPVSTCAVDCCRL